jgi:hypothetical protein
MELGNYIKMVEKVIASLGVAPETCRGQKEGQWDLKKGSASVWVDVFLTETKDYGYFQCMAPISMVPATRKEEFLQEALEINHKLYGVGFTIHKDGLYIKMIRELEGIDESEMLAAFNRIGNYADDYDDYFKNKYFGGGGAPV